MKAVWYDELGPADDVLTYEDLDTPDAGPGEVRVKLEASGVNPADVTLVRVAMRRHRAAE